MLRAYYLDEPLSDAEAVEVGKALALPAGESLEQVAIPGPWPPLSWRNIASGDTEEHLQAAKDNLRRAGIERDHGRRVALIIPRDQYWGGVCVCAIWVLTGEYPVPVQPWVAGDDGPVRGLLQVF